MVFKDIKDWVTTIKDEVDRVNLLYKETQKITNVFTANAINGIQNGRLDSNIIHGLSLSGSTNTEDIEKYQEAIDKLIEKYDELSVQQTAQATAEDGLSESIAEKIIEQKTSIEAEQQEAMATYEATAAILAQNTATQQSTALTLQNVIATKALAAAKAALVVAGNMFITAALSFAIYKLIEGFDHLRKTLIPTKEELEELAQTAKQAVSDIKESFKDLETTTDDIKQRYAELAQGIDQASGKNLTLSTDDYNEFLDLSNQLAELFPNLTKRYDENGNAILNLSGDVDTITSSLNDLVEIQRQLANQEILKNIPDIYNDYHVNYKEYEEELNYVKGMQDKIKDIQENHPRNIRVSRDGLSLTLADTELDHNEIEYLRREIGELIGEELSSSSVSTASGVNVEFSLPKDSNLELVSTYIDKVLVNGISEQRKALESETFSFNQYLNSWLSGEWLYLQQDSEMQGAIQEILFNSNWLSKAIEDGVKTKDWDATAKWLKTNYLDIVDKLDDVEKINLSSLFNNELTPEETIALAEKVQQSFEDNNIQIKLDFILDGNVEGSMQNLVNRFNAKNIELLEGDENTSQDDLNEFFKKQSIDTEAEYEQWLKFAEGYNTATEAIEAWIETRKTKFSSFEDIWNSSSFKEAKEELLELAKSGEITDDVIESTQEYKVLIEDTGLSAEQARSRILDMLTSTEKLAAASKGLSNISSAYEEFKEKSFVTAETLSGLPESIKELEGFVDFEKIVGDPTNGNEAIQNAFDNIVTEWVNKNETLKGITEDTKEVYIANLKDIGVANAEKAVEEYLVNQQTIDKILDDYEAYIIDKGEVDEEYLKTLAQNNPELVQALIDTYSTDYKNWTDLLTQKAKAYNEFINAIKDSQNKMLSNPLISDESKAQYIVSNYEKYGEKIPDYMRELYDSYTSLGIDNPVLGINNEKLLAEFTQEDYDDAKEYLALIEKTNSAQNSLKLNLNKIDTDFDLGYKGSSNSKDSTQTYDWIETLLSRIQRKIANLGKIISATYETWTNRSKAVKNSISELNNELSKQRSAADKYLKKANSVGLDEKYAKRVRNGALDFSEVSNEKTNEKIEKYREYYEKYLEALDAEADLRADLASKYQEQFDLINSEYDAKLSLIEHQANMINGYLDQTEAKGHLTSEKYYQELIKLEESTQKELLDKRNKLQKSFEEMMASGNVKEYSEQWYDMKSEILAVDEAIQECDSSIIEFQNSIRDLEWEVFDKMQDMISQIQEESDWLIELMSNKDMYDDNGNWTEYADATAGLHAVNYNAYMAQADEYAKALKELDEVYKDDSLNQDYLDRRKELVDNQREMISNAEQEKQSIIDIAKNGYDVLLESLQELIDKQKEALSIERDLYDYQKNIKDKTKNISSIEKRLMSLQGDNSEENQAKIQQLTVELQEAREDLEETEMDRNISEREKLLDKLVDDTEEWINERLDKEDELLKNIIQNTNNKADEIKSTLETETSNVGTTISEAMNDIWTSDNGLNSIVSTYSDNFNSALTTTNDILNSIKELIQNMVKDSDSQVNESISYTEKDVERVKNITLKKTKATSDDYERYDIDKDGAINITDLVQIKKLSGYAVGSKRIAKDELAWTQEKGQELIYRASDGAMLTPLGAGDAVFTADMTQRLWEIASTPNMFGNVSATTLPKGIISNGINNNVQNDLSMSINMYGVQDVNGFVNELKQNKSFEKIVQTMTLGAVTKGNNSLNKYKY